jgi:hypothetical protein
VNGSQTTHAGHTPAERTTPAPHVLADRLLAAMSRMQAIEACEILGRADVAAAIRQTISTHGES